MKILSWNVLHIIHEINYAYDTSPVLEKYSGNEQIRLNAIANFISTLLSEDTIICLQEVPGDLLESIDFKNHTLYKHMHSRIPEIKNSEYLKTLYSNPNEYIVTIVPNVFSVTNINVIEFDEPSENVNKSGKACLFLTLKDLTIGNCHLPFGSSRRKKALTKLTEFINTKFIDKTYILIGDMNMKAQTLQKWLSNLECDAKVIEMPSATRKTSKIDHGIVSRGISVLETHVYDNHNMSDHSCISITFK